MPRKHYEMSSTQCNALISRWERKILKQMFAEAQRPAMVKWYNAHPEILDTLIAKAEFNRRVTPPTSQIKRFYLA